MLSEVIARNLPRIARSVARIVLTDVVFTACGSSGASDISASAIDGSSPEGSPGAAGDAAGDGGDYGSVSTTYPAFAVDMPQVLANQGAVLGSPVIVTVTWPAADPNTATWDAFADAIGGSSYWIAVTGEYGVGAATSGPANHVHMVEPLPKTMSYYELQNFVLVSLGGILPDAGAPEAGADAGDAGVNPTWPAPTTPDVGAGNQTIYGLFIPASTR